MGNIYINKNTGEKVQILNDSDSVFFELDNSVRIKKDVFLRTHDAMEQEIDPTAFFNANSTSNIMDIANQLKNIDSTKINENQSGTKVTYREKPVVLADSSLPNNIQSDNSIAPDMRKQMLDEFRKTMPGAQIPEIQNRNWDDDDEMFLNGNKKINIPEPVNPLDMMFKMFKNNYNITLNLNIEEKIPNPQFIGMVQENVEADAIEYYAKKISDKLLEEPDILKTEIYNQLKKIINDELGIVDKQN